MDLSIVIPAYNEERRIGPTLERILTYLHRQPWRAEILVVIDGSSDGTVGIVSQAPAGDTPVRVLDVPVNAAVGLRAAECSRRAATSGSSPMHLSTPIDDLELLRQAIAAGHDRDRLAGPGGVADHGSAAVAAPAHGRTFNWWRAAAGGSRNPDTQCGFKLFTADAAARVFPTSRSSTSDSTSRSSDARRLGLRVAEVPVT